jgi:hypothetical protein
MNDLHSKTVQKYAEIVNEVNKGIRLFSEFLNPKIFVDNQIFELENEGGFLDLTRTTWKELKFPNSGKSGVYFMFGYKDKAESMNALGVYVGKASHNSFIGARLHAHLNRARREDEYQYHFHDKDDHSYHLELISSLGFHDDFYFLAPALEEFLIYHLRDVSKIPLLNKLGG